MSEDFWAGAEIIHTYTRAQAIADEALVDLTALARDAGFRYPLAMTAAAHAETVAWASENRAPQDETGRAWDVLTTARHAARKAAPGTGRTAFQVSRIPNEPRAVRPTLVDMVLHIGPGDTAEPVFTVLLPGED